MKYKISFILLSLLVCTNLWAQEEESDSPVTDAFAGSMIIDNVITSYSIHYTKLYDQEYY